LVERGPLSPSTVARFATRLPTSKHCSKAASKKPEKVVTHSEHTPETFDQFLGFPYSRHPDRTPFEALEGEEERWMMYSRLYVLADYLDSQTLKATIIGILFVQIGNARSDKKSACITAQVIRYIYDNTVRHCGLRRLIVA
jgi:hypothetical protein